ncbi:unnamed protein product [Rangifer tarandus platyrhynchus]|uniref:Uncharacterized protein n=2 Tax=Rangifer tarandus platyrhynchus TaxID=3082113 RepID=A0ACB0FE55_RANTA|nr:unnamed protein product [Rangifer tarandus platyrhynchus]CAI9710316.1 unnamed protein product [Rangifer tarandus platyrhynchus]
MWKTSSHKIKPGFAIRKGVRCHSMIVLCKLQRSGQTCATGAEQQRSLLKSSKEPASYLQYQWYLRAAG